MGSDKTIDELENMTEQELEAHISKENSDLARFVLAKLLIEGCSEKVAKNDKKGQNWLKDSAKNGNIDALEYKTQMDIRFAKQPNIQKIMESLQKVIDKTGSHKSCNIMGEFNHAQDKKPGSKELAAKYYLQSHEKGCQIGTHWLGVFHHEGFGVNKNVEKAIELLKQSAERGNGQSMYQLHLIYCSDEKHKDVKQAYIYLTRAVQVGVTYFDQLIHYFNEHVEELAETYFKTQRLDMQLTKENKKDITNMHTATVNEWKNNFSAALNKDRLYHKPCGFLNDQQIWLVGVQCRYMVDKVLRFDHVDFLKAVKQDIGPILGDTGLWALKLQQDACKNAGNKDEAKKVGVAIDLVQNYMENNLTVLSQEKKYNFTNKFGPKKCPDQQIKRSSVEILYSWNDYAPLAWYQYLDQLESSMKKAKDQKDITGKLCSHCSSPEGAVSKHLVCSQCKQRFYCCKDCQRFDWKAGHKNECKELAKKIKK